MKNSQFYIMYFHCDFMTVNESQSNFHPVFYFLLFSCELIKYTLNNLCNIFKGANYISIRILKSVMLKILFFG